MGSRLELQEVLEGILGSDEVYFQPPESVKMSYPAIVYNLSFIQTRYANDGVYEQHREYLVTVVDRDPDSDILNKISRLPHCRFSRHYTADNLNHYVFALHY